MDPIRHPSHPHPLFYRDAPCPGMHQCQGCGKDCGGPTFGCERCNFGLHKWCANQPLQISKHPLHPNHKLTMVPSVSVSETLVCNECSLPFIGCFHYRCFYCDLRLHLSCAASTMNLQPQHPIRDQDYTYTYRSSRMVSSTFKHSCHHHELILYDHVYIENFIRLIDACQWCRKTVSSSAGKLYACLPCKFYLHEACTFKLPKEIEHPCFPKKYLRLRHLGQPQSGYPPCCTCRGELSGILYVHENRSVNPFLSPTHKSEYYEKRKYPALHGHCIIFLPSLKSTHDRHNLTYLEKANYRGDFRCYKCGDQTCLSSDNYNGFYRCSVCDINFHLSCILPSAIKYKYHSCWSPLVLKNPIKDDFYYEYYCDICETKRHPDHSVYSCRECYSFDAHIECAKGQERVEQPDEPVSIIQSLKVKPMLDNVIEQGIHHDQEHQIKHPNHDHRLSLGDVVVNVERAHRHCKGCKQKVFGQAFICTKCRNYCLHDVCAKLSSSSNQLFQSPLHSLHPLILNFQYIQGKRFICDACGEIKESDCFHYRCQECEFIMDLKCASLSEPITEGFKKLEPSFHYGIHKHMLFLGNYNNKERFYCSGCLHPVLGLTYCCLTCNFFLHDSCFRRFTPQLELQLPFPFPSLHSFNITFQDNNKLSCFACGFPLRGGDLCYTSDLHLHLHPICAIALIRPLVNEAHYHSLYYFARDCQVMFKTLKQEVECSFEWFQCNKCSEFCTGSFYRCLEGERHNFHLECVPIPQVVKSKCHRHHLKLKDSFIVEGYDYHDQYCDVCEEKRDPKDHVYFCEACFDLVVGHIECVLSKMEKIIEATPRALTDLAGCNDLESDHSKIIKDEPLKLVIEKNFVQTFGENVCSMDLHPMKPWILVGLYSGNVCIWNYQSQNKEMSFSVTKLSVLPDLHPAPLTRTLSSVKFITRKSWIVTGAYDGFISIYNYETSIFIHEFEAHYKEITCVVVHPSHPYVLSSSSDGLIRLWNWEKGWSCMQEFQGHHYFQNLFLVFNPKDLNTFASGSTDGTILIWSIDSPHPVHGFRTSHPAHGFRTTCRLSCIDFSMAGAELFLGIGEYRDYSAQVWDYRNKRCVQTLLEHHKDKVTAISAHPDFPIIITCSEGGTVYVPEKGGTICIWNSRNYRLQKMLKLKNLGDVIAIGCLKGSYHITFGCEGGIVMVKITNSKDCNATKFQFDNEKKEESFYEGSGEEITEFQEDMKVLCVDPIYGDALVEESSSYWIN